MSYQVLARKWRPKSFETLVGQDHVVRALTNALTQNRLHHAYLFTGTRGVGKTTLARILAKSLNCETGITATPCDACAACLEIDKGRFVDLIEVDAASNTQVDAMRDLLDNAQYAPTAGRFKVYIIDEVHMLSKSAFNAMLKTLEEPPAHVKFILATTDPQKVPVTVLSRCLQFNLRQMASTSIIEHLQNILTQENIPYEPAALHMVARAAAGSMRDALSLTDQAIAYSGQQVTEAEVRAMLGAIDQSYLYQLITALLANDGASLMEQAQLMQERSLSFEAALNDLAQLLHQIAVAQTVPESIANDLPERAVLMQLAQTIPAETLQLYYQITVLGRRDIGLAPDEYAGFTMTLLRMLSFTPNETSGTGQKITTPGMVKPVVEPAAKTAVEPVIVEQTQLMSVKNITGTPQKLINSEPAKVSLDKTIQSTPEAETPRINAPELTQKPIENATASAQTTAQPPTNDDDSNLATNQSTASAPGAFNGDWRNLVNELKLGLAKALAQQCELVSYDEHSISLTVPEAQKHLLLPNYQEKLSSAIAQYFGKKVRLQFSIGGTGNTPAKQMLQEKAHAQANAVSAIENDHFVKALINDFNAQIIPNSIKPLA